jgi:predicted RecB family nuclease
MQKFGISVVFSPSDLNHFLECAYLTHLDLEMANGRALQKRRRPEADLLAAKGEVHEHFHLAQFRGQGKVVVEIPDPGPHVDWDSAAHATQAAMVAGAEVIYQGVLIASGWRGRADFLVRVNTPSALGHWSYEVYDTKLARHARPSHILQLAYYSEQVAAIQRLEPEWMHVILGTGESSRFRCREFTAYLRAVRRSFLHAVPALGDVSPYPVAHCGTCGYSDHCEEQWHAGDHLSLVAGMRRMQAERLQEIGVRTCADLASINGVSVRIGEAALERLRHQASLQTHFRRSGEHRYDLLPPREENGFRLLPSPSPGDVFFDMEGYPFFESSGGLEYLFGTVTADEGRPRFQGFRAADRVSEKRAFEQLIDFLWERLRRWPDLHVYHYSHYEPTALKRLTALHATREEEVDELLRGEAFVDLFQVVRRSLRISHDNYSIKAVRQFFMSDAGKGEITGGGESIVEFQRWLDTGDARILEAIERYNEEDCVSTLKLRDWLLERKREAEGRFELTIPFLSPPARRDEPVETEPDEHADLRRRLASLGEGWAATLAHLLDYHRREAKPDWWAFFERRKKSLDDLLDDTEAVAHLTPTGDLPVPKDQSLVYTLEFPPQEFKLKVETKVDGPLGEGFAGTIDWIDASLGRLALRRGKKRSHEPLPAAIVAAGPVPDDPQRAALVRVAEAAARRQSPYRAVQAMLRREALRVSPPRKGGIQTLDLNEQQRLVADLDGSYLFVQGPPGSGKTWTGARLIVSLLSAGKRLGVTGPNHKAIHNLLDEVERVAIEEGVTFTGIKKRSTSDETAYEGRFITSIKKNDLVEASDAQLMAGTAWLFARSGMDQSLDYLFVDEAGQLALADAVAVGTAARNIVLLGDPQQLPHVTQNTHPEGSGGSVLEHLLGDAATIPEDRGIFLAQSWRMHPELCRFVSEHSYDGRLASAAGCERQQVTSAGLAGAGLRYIPVEHRHNAQQSPEEGAAIAAEVERLLRGGTVIDSTGQTRPLTVADVLVVAPYNMQVRCLRDALPAGVEVGTVDKFQGREAAVVFFSMAASSGEDVPRGLEFLFNRNRFNVAVSRAKCLSALVCSPRLLEARCRTVEQVRLVNALCRFAEASTTASRCSPAESLTP